MKYLIYVRKSTEDREDKQVLSIESQIEEIKGKFPSYDVVEIIKESKSAYKPYNRPEFQRMIEIFESGKAQGLLAWHPDRLSREPISGGMVMHLLDKGVIKDLKFASYNFQLSPEGKMMLALTLSQSKYFSEKLSIDVKRGMLKKCKLGSMPTKPPLGYMPDRLAEKGEKRHIKDPERFDLVRKMWELMLTGQYSIQKIINIATSWGLTTRPTKRIPAQTLSKATAHRMFSDSYYAGEFVWNNEKYQGNYPAMVTMEEFTKVQILIGNKYVPRPKKNETFFSGLIKCACGASIVLESKTKFVKAENKFKTYEYARCSRGKKGEKCIDPVIKLDDLKNQAIEYLKNIKISDAFHKWAVKHAQTVQLSEKEDRSMELASLRRAHDDCQKKLDNLLDLKISPSNSDGSLLSDEDFKKRKDELTVERDRFLSSINQINLRADKWAVIIQEVFDVAYNAQREFEETEDVQKKKDLLAKIGANLTLSNGKLDIQGKESYIVFKNRLPESRRIEERSELEVRLYGKPKEATLNELYTNWSE